MSSQMLINDFLTKKNVELIWEVIMDDILKYKPQEIILQTNKIFNSNLKGFFDNEKNKTNSLMELNKKFISLIINYIIQNFSQKQDIKQPDIKQDINNKERKELVTHDDLQTDRMSQFDKKLNLRKQDFTNAMTLPVPKAPEFSDKADGPFGELELEIKKVMAQRNYDIEQINRNISTNNDGLNTNSNWLKSQETSIKNEKVNPLLQNNQNNQNNKHLQQQQIKYIKIDNNDLNNELIQNEVIDINNSFEQKQLSSKKQVSWNNTVEYENVNSNENELDFEPDFFKKLKTIKPSISETEIKNNNINNNNINSSNNLFDNNEINIMKEDMKTINVKLENLTQNMNTILELLRNKI